jgi:RES domain-containing protein
MGSICLWRIVKHTTHYAADDMCGGGAKVTGGRWNVKGSAVIYSSTSIALATLETRAHLGDDITVLNMFLVRIEVPAAVWKRRQELALPSLDPTWAAEPPGMTSQAAGQRWLLAQESALLTVPSVIVPEEFNVLINPAHADSAKLVASVVRHYIYDPRLR